MLTRALTVAAAACGCAITVIDLRSVPWSSATFVGEQHQVVVATQDDAAAWLAALPEAEFALPGHLIADLRVVGTDGDGIATIEVLTLIES